MSGVVPNGRDDIHASSHFSWCQCGEILDECIRPGGSVTGEHGIGVEKLDFMPKLFGPENLSFMVRLRSAFNSENRCSPNKLLPTAGACIEPSKVATIKLGRRAAV